jgi:DNA-directed RNA polymerase specialized sigma subunit
MTNQEILDMCRRLAGKYRNSQEYDDLVSEGVVKCLDLRAGGVDSPAALYYEARRSMHYYYNVGSSQISYPKGQAGLDRIKEDNTSFLNINDTEEDFELASLDDVFGSYELKNVLEVLGKVLDKEEKELLLSFWSNNNNSAAVGRSLGISRQACEKRLDKIKSKIVTICDVA